MKSASLFPAAGRGAVTNRRTLRSYFGAWVAFGALTACLSAPDLNRFEGRPSAALPAAQDSALGRLFHADDSAEESPAKLSHFAPVDGGDEAFDVRLALIAAAESSIDVQSYLWHADSSGGLLLERLLEAADRGVRVRLLIDGFQVEDRTLDQGLDTHPNLELRVFNPTLHRALLWRAVETLEHLERFDHRMHNKLLVADGVVAVTGGRNVGDEYLGLGSAFDFRDFDLLAAGPIVEDLEEAFDAFWNGELALPVRDPSESEEAAAEELTEARRILAGLHERDERLHRRRALGRDAWLAALAHARTRMLAGRARMIHDSAHVLQEGATGLMAHAFEQALRADHGDVWIVTAYLVPDEAFLESVRQHTSAGHRVQILTNSMLTTNQPLAHAFYQESRRDLLAMGAELYELRPDAFSHAYHRSPGSRGRFLGLHAKSAVIGADHVLVGSMNVDPRSMALNTEMGLLVESRELAEEVQRRLAREFLPRNAWRVSLAEDGRLQWASEGEVLRQEPSPGRWSRFLSWLRGWLPLRGEV